MRLAILLAAAASLAACGGPDPVADNLQNTSELPTINQASPSPTGAAPADGVPAGNLVTTAASKIPSNLQGRWGLSPADCMAPLSEAKGLLVINSDELRFYESRGVPGARVQTSPHAISGDFAFTGEGQQWSKHITLELRGGNLVRTERDPVASFTYVRCT